MIYISERNYRVLNIKVEELGMCQVQLTVEPEATQVEQARKEVAKKYRKQVKIRGFRAGKAPLHMVMRALGPQQLLDEVAQLIIQDVFTQALDQANLDIYSYDDLNTEITHHDPLTYRFTFPSTPTMKLGELKWIKVEPKEATVSDEQLHRRLEDIRLRSATVESIKGPAQYGDQAIYDLRIEAEDGSTVANDKNQMEYLTATPNNVEETESQQVNIGSYLVGLSVDEPHEFELIYPEHWADGKFSGQTMTYYINLTDLKRFVLPELNDEFAQKTAQVPTMDIWREKMSLELLAQARRDEFNRVNTEILNALVDESEIEYPQVMLKHQIRDYIANLEQQWKNRGSTLAEALQRDGKTLDELEDDMRDDAERDLLRSLVLNQYIMDNQISLTNEELEFEFENLLKAYGPESGLNIEQLQKDQNFLMRFSNEIVSRKGLAHLYTTVIGHEPPALYDEVAAENALEENTSDTEESVPEEVSEEVSEDTNQDAFKEVIEVQSNSSAE